MTIFIRPVSGRQAAIASACLLLLYLIAGLRSAHLVDPWRVDEGQRIAESYFWRLVVLRGDISNPDWFNRIAIRSHPPVNKYFFGAALAAAGVETPRNLDLVDSYDAGTPAAVMPAAFASEYLPMRRPARIAVLALSLLTAVVIFAVSLRFWGAAAAAISQLVVFRQFLFVENLYHARSDVLEAFLTFITIIPLLCLAFCQERPRVQLAAAGVAGALAALAFQTRLNGGVALLMCLSFLALAAPRRIVRNALAAITAFGAAAVLVNPFYWAVARRGPGVPEACLIPAPLPMRIIHRFALQVQDLRVLLVGIDPKWRLDSLAAKTAYIFSILFSGKAGMIILAGVVIALAMMVTKRLSFLERAIVAWGMTDLVITTIWIPLRWDSYLLIVLGPLELAAFLGYGVAFRECARLRANLAQRKTTRGSSVRPLSAGVVGDQASSEETSQSGGVLEAQSQPRDPAR